MVEVCCSKDVSAAQCSSLRSDDLRLREKNVETEAGHDEPPMSSILS